jgi:spore germination protein
MPRRRLMTALAAAAAVLLVGGGVLRWSPWPGSESLVVAGYLPIGTFSAEVLENALDEGLTEVSPVWASVRADGTLDTTEFPAGVRRQLDRPGLRVLPTVQNYVDGEWQGDLVADVLGSPRRAEAHREELVDAVLEHGWDGIDIDYEALPPVAGESFVDFLSALRDDLHAHDLVLSVAVPARVSDEETWTLAYSYQRLGQVADQVRVMAYDHAWSGSTAGPVAPLPWVEDVVAYARERIPPGKLTLGVATYGYDWVGSTGVYLPATAVFELANKTGAVPRWDPAAAASTFSYELKGEQHTVWYEDARSLEAKLAVAAREGLRGVALWQIGGEDPGVWGVLADITGD